MDLCQANLGLCQANLGLYQTNVSFSPPPWQPLSFVRPFGLYLANLDRGTPPQELILVNLGLTLAHQKLILAHQRLTFL